MTTSVGRTTAAAVALLLLPSLRAAAAAAAPGTLVWSTQLSCNASIPTTIVWSSPVVDPHRGAVFIGSRDTDLYRLDARDGRIVYNVSVGGYIDSSPTLSALIGDVIYLGASGNDSVVAVGADDGAIVWRSAAEHGFIDSTPAQSPDHLWLAVSDDGGYVHLLSALDGREAWQVTFSEGVPVYSSPAFSRDGGALYFGSDDTHLYAVASADGAALWAVATGAQVQSTPTVGPDGAVVFGSWDSTVTSVEPNGRVRWSATTGGKVDASARFSPDGALVYMGSYDGFVYALDAASGALVWRAATGGQVRSSATPSADGTLVFVGSSDGFLYAFDAKSGETAWRSFCGDSDPEYGVRSTPALSLDQRHVYVGSADGFAYCFESGAASPVIVTES